MKYKELATNFSLLASPDRKAQGNSMIWKSDRPEAQKLTCFVYKVKGASWEDWFLWGASGREFPTAREERQPLSHKEAERKASSWGPA